MMVPVRCFSCGKIVADDYEKFKELAKRKSVLEVFNELQIDRPCCRRMYLSSVEFIDELMEYQKWN